MLKCLAAIVAVVLFADPASGCTLGFAPTPSFDSAHYTPYGDYANLLLGEYHAARRDAANARRYLTRIAGKPDFPLAERAAKRLAELGAP